jgi:hypothetical protein
MNETQFLLSSYIHGILKMLFTKFHYTTKQLVYSVMERLNILLRHKQHVNSIFENFSNELKKRTLHISSSTMQHHT